MAKKLHLGAQLYTIRKNLKYKKDFEPVLTEVKKMGFKYVQVSGVPDRITDDMIYEVTNKLGLQIGLTHWHDEIIVNQPEVACDTHDRFNCQGIGIGGMPRKYRNYQGYDKFLKEYGKAFKTFKKRGKVFCYHNHWFEFERYKNGKTGMEMLLEKTDPEVFKLTCDIAWLVKAGVNPAAFIEKYHDRIYATHFKDTTVKDDEPTLTEMLCGNTDYDSIVKVCKKYGIVWHFLEQDWGYIKDDPMLSLKTSRNNVVKRYGDIFD